MSWRSNGVVGCSGWCRRRNGWLRVVGHRGNHDGPAAARIHSGRPACSKFAGHFHGWNDFLIPDADPPYGAAVAGVLGEVRRNTVVAPPNDPDAVEQALVEGSRHRLRHSGADGRPLGRAVPCAVPSCSAALTVRHDCLLIFDEVISGFRVSPGERPGTLRRQAGPDHAGQDPAGVCRWLRRGRADVLGLQHVLREQDEAPWHFQRQSVVGISRRGDAATGGQRRPGLPRRHAAQQLRHRLNALFADAARWVAYGEFSGFRLLPNYQGPRPAERGFHPLRRRFPASGYAGGAQLRDAFRQAMLLHGVDLPGLSGMTTAAHTNADVEETVAAVAGTLELLQAEGQA